MNGAGFMRRTFLAAKDGDNADYMRANDKPRARFVKAIIGDGRTAARGRGRGWLVRQNPL
jgi:hypothetical protein